MEVKALAACAFAIGCQGSEPAPQPATATAPVSAITAAQCGLFLTKARPVLEELATRSGMAYTKPIEDSALRDCQADVAAGKPMVFARCVIDAPTEAALHACFPAYDAVEQP